MISHRSLRAHLGLVVLCAAFGCTSPNPVVPRRAAAADVPERGSSQAAPGPEVSAPAPRFVPASSAVAYVDGGAVGVSELLGTWMHADSRSVRDMLERVVSARIVESEAEKLGIELDELLLTDEFALTIAKRERELQLSQPGMTFDDWISQGLGLDPETYRMRLRNDVRLRLLAERIVRVFIYSQEWAEARVIIVEKRGEADAVLERLRAGEPFARVASEDSIDPTGKAGGRVPPVLRNDSAIARLAFSMTPGEVGGPIFESERWMVLGLDELHAPLEGTWAEVEAEIEASLLQRPIEDPEYWMWKVEMNRMHPVDLSPLLELIGDAPPGTF